LDQIADRSAEWVQRILAGDADAEQELISRFQNSIRLIILRRTGDPQLANDVSQETFMLALQKLRAGEVRNPDSLPAFLRQIAINISIHHYRKERRFVSTDQDALDQKVVHHPQHEHELDTRKLRESLEMALNNLGKPRDQEILRRFYLRDEDKEEICQDLQLSEAHFDRVLFRARQRMRNLINRKKDLKALLLGGLTDG